MAKDENVMQTLLKVSKKGDKSDVLIFEVLSKCEKKTDLIKNALFNYIINIQNGNIIDRAYPYNQIEKFTELEKEKVIYNYSNISNGVTTSNNANDDDDNYYNDKDNNEYEDDEYEDIEVEENQYEEDNSDIF